MKKLNGKTIITALCCCMAVPVMLSAVGCDKTPEDTTKKYNNETRAVTIAIGTVDRNFNPFFYTALNDGEVVSPTQIPMITADENGDVACGQNEATVALAYKYTMYDANGNVTEQGSTDGTTVYEFVIKNGIKYSDGEDLTIKDVLFNLYVYLDPLYSGSSTIYSTKIKGLNRYRSQQPNADDSDSSSSYQDQFMPAANERFNALINFDSNDFSGTPSEQMEKDLVTVGTKFKEELTTDWNNNVGTLDGYEDYLFTEDWEVFMFNEGFISYIYDRNPATNALVRLTDANGKYLTTLDTNPKTGEPGPHAGLRGLIEQAAGNLTGTERAEAIKNEAIDIVYENYLTNTETNGTVTQVRPTSTGKLRQILNEWATGGTVRQEFINDAMSSYYSDMTAGGGLAVKEISGIETYRTNTFSGALKGDSLDPNQTYDVLKITINGVDPAAIWNFGFNVAPMHYYSGSVGDTNYITECDPNNTAKSNRFGVAFANKEFFDTVLNLDTKTLKPVGAGPYMVTRDKVYVNEEAQYERNPYFETVGTGIENAKIKTLQYRSISDSELINSLISREVDYASPQCTPKVITQLNGQGLEQIQYDANGFGYVGINPKYIPEIGIRQAIMKAMNVNSITANYYTSNYASVIYRPVSLTSWVYTESSTAERQQYFTEYEDIKYAAENYDEYEMLLRRAGCNKVGGLWYNKDGQQLKYTFTIAGESEDHPAFDMFTDAAEILNKVGFEITVQKDIQALSKLAQGKLAVWAAAWSTGIDPDMYQVYHKDSKATSVKNWGYDVILQDPEKYADEYKIIAGDPNDSEYKSLSDLIEEGRSVINRDTRRRTYYQALNRVMELAVELPTYQRKELVVYNGDVIKSSSLNQKANANSGVLDRLWELDFN